MANREKAIKGMECIISSGNAGMRDDCKNCIYPGGGDCLAPALRDALALLKAQEPHVMTIEEIEQWNQPDVWMEMKDGKPDICGDYLTPMTRMHYEFWCAIIVDGSKHPPALNGDYYGKTWRCWTSRPTDEQREKEKWDG